MATVVTGDVRRAARRAEADPASLVVWIGPDAAMSTTMTGAAIRVSLRSPLLARKLTKAMASALRAAADDGPLPEVRSVLVRSRKDVAGSEGALAIVPLTARNLRRIGELVEALRAGGALGVQLVWDGRDPAPVIAEASVFAALERARTTPGQAPVVLARGAAPAEALRILITARGKKGQGQP